MSKRTSRGLPKLGQRHKPPPNQPSYQPLSGMSGDKGWGVVIDPRDGTIYAPDGGQTAEAVGRVISQGAGGMTVQGKSGATYHIDTSTGEIMGKEIDTGTKRFGQDNPGYKRAS